MAISNQKILITGGAGFIGSALIGEYKKSSAEIFVIDNLSFGNRAYIEIPDANFFKEDIRDAAKMNAIIQRIQPDIVIHLAAIHFIPYCNQHPFEASEVNLMGTMNIIDACKRTRSVKKFFFASTAAVYPVFDGALTEDHECKPLDIYGLSKLCGERLVHEFHLSTQIPSIVCRFFNAFGPNETNPHVIPEIQQQLNSGIRILTLGNLEPKRDYIHTYDMAEAVSLLVEKVESGFEVFNLGSGKEYSVRELVHVFEQQISEKLTIEQNPLRMRKADRMHLLADITKIKKFISWQPKIDIEEGIGTLVRNRVTV